MLSTIWGRVTGKDKKKKYPDQQGIFLSRVGDYTIISPYGLYADLPKETLLLELKQGTAISITVTRPSDIEQGEPVFYHPATNSRIIARNNGDIDITGTGKINITAQEVIATASVTTLNSNVTINGTLSVTGQATLAGVTSNSKNIGSTHTHPQGVDSRGDVQQNTGMPV